MRIDPKEISTASSNRPVQITVAVILLLVVYSVIGRPDHRAIEEQIAPVVAKAPVAKQVKAAKGAKVATAKKPAAEVIASKIDLPEITKVPPQGLIKEIKEAIQEPVKEPVKEARAAITEPAPRVPVVAPEDMPVFVEDEAKPTRGSGYVWVTGEANSYSVGNDGVKVVGGDGSVKKLGQ